MLATDTQHRDHKKVPGGVGGMGKHARACLREIQENPEKTFHGAFNTESGKFIIARKGGKKQIKIGLYRYNINKNKLFSMTCGRVLQY